MLSLTTYSLTMVPLRKGHNRTQPGSHTLPKECDHQHAVSMTKGAQNSLWYLLTLAFHISETMQPTARSLTPTLALVYDN